MNRHIQLVLWFYTCSAISLKSSVGKVLRTVNPLKAGNTGDKRDLASDILHSVIPGSCLSEFLYIGEIGRDEDDYPFTPKCAASGAQQMSCFPKGSQVLMSTGESKAIENLTVGDLVQDGGEDGTSTEVIGWLHRKTKTPTPQIWVELVTKNNQTLLASWNHIVFARALPLRSPVEIELPIGAIEPGQSLIDSTAGSVEVIRIRHLELPADRGLYAPLTRSGKLTIAGLKVSAFSALSPRDDVRLGALLGAAEHNGWGEHKYIMEHRGGAAIIRLLSILTPLTRWLK